MTNRSKYLAVALLALTSTLLSACGSEDSSSASVPAPPPPPQAGGTGDSTPSPSPSGSLVCSQVYVYGIVVQVKDPSGNPVPNAQVVIRDGNYTENLSQMDTPSPTGIYQGAGERPGKYDLTVSAPGYAPQTFENLVVSGGVCHVSQVTKEVSLLPY
jgi:hypothetical protein